MGLSSPAGVSRQTERPPGALLEKGLKKGTGLGGALVNVEEKSLAAGAPALKADKAPPRRFGGSRGTRAGLADGAGADATRRGEKRAQNPGSRRVTEVVGLFGAGAAYPISSFMFLRRGRRLALKRPG
jgi:hypothetical protein